MGLFKKTIKTENAFHTIKNIGDEDIVAMASGIVIDITSLPDPLFAESVMGETMAFTYEADKVTLCSPANGKLSVLFPTGHAFGVTMNNGVELLVHCGINTVQENGKGFTILQKKQGDIVKAGEPIIEVDIKKLSRKYDMSTMLIITENNSREVHFIKKDKVSLGEKINIIN